MMKRYLRGSWMAVRIIFIVFLCVMPVFYSTGIGEEPGVVEGGTGEIAPGLIRPGVGKVTFSTAWRTSADYDSGWLTFETNTPLTLTHGLGGNVSDYVVYMEFYNDTRGDKVNQMFYGGVDFGAKTSSGLADNQRRGGYWRSLTSSSITLYRMPEDVYAEKVRVRIWVDNSPDYDSGWVSVATDETKTLTHNLGGSADDYVVYMEYMNPDYGLHNAYFSGNDFGAFSYGGMRENDRVGLYWRTLTNTSITLYRRPQDDFATTVRIRIWVRPVPTYDSGWTTINKDEQKFFYHNIYGNTDDYVVDLQFRSAANGVNQRFYGGGDMGANPAPGLVENDRVGAYWTLLNSGLIEVYRRAEDIYAEEVRVRIWRFWKPSAPQYDSGWLNSSATPNLWTLTHNLSGDVSQYYLTLEFASLGMGVNQIFYGGCDVGPDTWGASYDNDRMGSYWYGLSNTDVKVVRRAEDLYSPFVRMRIWVAPKPDYDSGWTAISQDATQVFTHNLGGDPMYFLVDMEQRAVGIIGINQLAYGGLDVGNQPPVGLSENDRVGAYWRSLTSSSIVVYRRPEDPYAADVRIRIWRMARPDYDSGWSVIAKNAELIFTHNLGGNQNRYLTSLVQYDLDGGNGMNHRHYGGDDLGDNPSSGYSANDQVGASFSHLTAVGVSVTRRADDGFSDDVRFRIWRTPPRVSFNQILQHILKASVLEGRDLNEADTNGDAKVDVADLVFWVRVYSK